MEFQILGPLEVRRADELLSLGGPKQRALLGILLINANRVVPGDRLIELIWGEDAPQTAGATLQVTVSNLRKILEPDHARGSAYELLVSQPAGYLLRLSPEQLDSARFEALAAEGRDALRTGNAEIAADKLNQALALWRGPALADFSDERFALADTKRLNEMMLQALEDRIEADLALGHHAELVGELESLTVKHPLRERLCGQLMLALYRCGRQAEASDVYYRTREALVDQQGMDPGAELQHLLKGILNHDPLLALPHEAARPARSNNLPNPLTTFIARSDQVSRVKRLLSENRLITLTGSGGVGKTRLAIEVGQSVLADYEDGVWLVELAPLTDRDLMAQTVASSLGLREQGGTPIIKTLTDYLADRKALLIIDNCEHLIEESARIARGLLETCPEVRILATSREALEIGGEIAWRVPSLSVPDSVDRFSPQALQGYEAVAMFVDRAARIRDAFRLTETNSEPVARICRALDGIPLAIELAAARLAVLSPDQILDRLGDRFQLLRGGDRSNLPRQQTLRAAIDWSYDLLSDDERLLLRRFSAFAGGAGLDACESVCAGGGISSGDVLTLLAELVRKSLVLIDESRIEVRYRLLETIRQYSRELLVERGEQESAEHRHHAWFSALAQRAENQLQGPDQVRWFDILEADRDNLRAALDSSLDHDSPEGSLRFVGALARFWRVRGYLTEGRLWLARALSRTTASSAGRAKALAWAALLAEDQSDYAAGVSLGTQSLSMFRVVGDKAGTALALQVLGSAGIHQDDYAGATGLLEESLELSREVNDGPASATSLYLLGQIAVIKGSYDRAMQLNKEALQIAREGGALRQAALALRALGEVELRLGNYPSAASFGEQALSLLDQLKDQRIRAYTLHSLGIVARCQRDYARASALQEESCTVFRDLGSRAAAAYGELELGMVMMAKGDWVRADSLMMRSLSTFYEIHDRMGLAKALEAMSAAACHGPDLHQAARLAGAAMAVRTEIGVPVEPFERADHDGRISSMRQALGAAAATAAFEAGRCMTTEQRMALVQEVHSVAVAAGTS